MILALDALSTCSAGSVSSTSSRRNSWFQEMCSVIVDAKNVFDFSHCLLVLIGFPP